MTSPLQDLWPDDIRTQEVASPRQILDWQAEALIRRTGGLVLAEVVQSETNDRIILGLEGEATGVRERARLLEVQHLPGRLYPAAIVPPEEQVPDFLKKTRYIPTMGDAARALAQFDRGRQIENEWVASTPIEFADKVRKALSSPSVKSIVMSLLARAQESSAVETNGDNDASGLSS
jgi:hypothetical protein